MIDLKNENTKLNEGKTKIIYQYGEDEDLVIISSKDRITAGDGARSNDLIGKAGVSNETASYIFQLLNRAGLKTHFIKQLSAKEFLAKKCEMFPIEFVIRRIATGSFLKRNIGVNEGFKFCPPKIEYFFKDDENHDPQWSKEQMLCYFSQNKFGKSYRLITESDLDIIDQVTTTIFLILEKYWSLIGCQLIDMKIEFGYNEKTNEILLADLIDSDSWRLWPQGDKNLMVDKQVYRNLSVVTENDLKLVLKNFTWILDKIKEFTNLKSNIRVVVIMGSQSDLNFSNEIKEFCKSLNVDCHLRIASAHKQPAVVANIVAQYEGNNLHTVFIAVAGRSNGLGPVIAGLTSNPVINCPPVQPPWNNEDIWSSLRMPSGVGCSTVLSSESAALASCQILAMHDVVLWSKLKTKKLNQSIQLIREDNKLCSYMMLQ